MYPYRYIGICDGENAKAKPLETRNKASTIYYLYTDIINNVNEKVKFLNFISHVSVQPARNLSILGDTNIGRIEFPIFPVKFIFYVFLLLRKPLYHLGIDLHIPLDLLP